MTWWMKLLDRFWYFCLFFLFCPKMCKNHNFLDDLYFLWMFIKFLNLGIIQCRKRCQKNLLKQISNKLFHFPFWVKYSIFIKWKHVHCTFSSRCTIISRLRIYYNPFLSSLIHQIPIVMNDQWKGSELGY